MTTRNLGSEGFNWFFGVVEDRDDPLKLGRVRVRIHNFHEDDELIPKNTLHWSNIIMPPTSASANSIGTSPTGIAVGSTVFGFFVDGAEKQKPVVLGTMHGIPEVDDHDVSLLARANGDGGGIQKQPIGPEPVSPFLARYPYNKTITTESGHAIELDDTPGHERMHVYHKSGSYIEINSEGRKVTKVVSDDIEVVIKDKKVHILGNADIYVGGSADIEVVGNADILVRGNAKSTVGGNHEHQVVGNLKIEASGKIDITSSGNMTLNAPRIDLNPPSGEAVEIDIPALEAQANEAAVVNILGRAAIIDDTIGEPEYAAVAARYEATPSVPSVGSLQSSITTDSTAPAAVATPTVGDCENVTTADDNYALSSRFTLGMLSTKALYSHTIQPQAGLSISQIVCNLKALVEEVLDPLAAQYPGFRINSGFRVGSGKSQHERGQACDIQWSGISAAEYKVRAQWIRDNLIYDQLIFEHGKSIWIHVSFNRNIATQRKQILTMYNESYTPGITLYYA